MDVLHAVTLSIHPSIATVDFALRRLSELDKKVDELARSLIVTNEKLRVTRDPKYGCGADVETWSVTDKRQLGSIAGILRHMKDEVTSTIQIAKLSLVAAQPHMTPEGFLSYQEKIEDFERSLPPKTADECKKAHFSF